MACVTLSKQPNGAYTIQVGLGGSKRHSIRLGKVPKKNAESVKTSVKYLVNAKLAGVPADPEVARWVGSVGEDLHAKLAALGLVTARPTSARLDEFLNDYLARRQREGKGSTALTVGTVVTDLLGFFPGRTLSSAGADPYTLTRPGRAW